MFHLAPLLLLTRWAGDKKVKMGITKYAKEDVQKVGSVVLLVTDAPAAAT